MSKPIASARIPHSWHDQICAIATESGRTPSNVVKEAIGLYLEKTDPDGVAFMGRRLSTLEKQVRKLLQQGKRILISCQRRNQAPSVWAVGNRFHFFQ